MADETKTNAANHPVWTLMAKNSERVNQMPDWKKGERIANRSSLINPKFSNPLKSNSNS